MMKTLSNVLLMSTIVLTMSCNTSEYEGYKKAKTGFHYKLIKIGDDTLKCEYNDFITANICYKTLKDSVFFTGQRKFKIAPADFPGSIDECLTYLGEDDSASFIISANDFFAKTLSSQLPSFLKETDKIKVDVSIIDIQTPDEYIREKQAFLKWIDDFGEYEKTILQQFLEEKKLKISPLSNGMYYLAIQKGNERTVKLGDTVSVHYEGRFLNGKFFDSTRKRNEAFQFVYGQQWQVIQGMEEAIGMMHEGEKALFIMPSNLAFGETGSSTGIIPPFTSLIFEVELLSIN